MPQIIPAKRIHLHIPQKLLREMYSATKKLTPAKVKRLRSKLKQVETVKYLLEHVESVIKKILLRDLFDKDR